MKNIETILTKHLTKNQDCNTGILSGERVFIRYDTKIASKEILVLIDVCDIWAHVFQDKNSWYTTLVFIPVVFNAKDINDLFRNFWSRIELANKDLNSIFWFPANDSHATYKTIYKNTCFDAALKDLINIIYNYRNWHNEIDKGECDHFFQIQRVYAELELSQR